MHLSRNLLSSIQNIYVELIKCFHDGRECLDVTNTYLGEAIGKLYVDENFPPEAKQKALGYG